MYWKVTWIRNNEYYFKVIPTFPLRDSELTVVPVSHVLTNGVQSNQIHTRHLSMQSDDVKRRVKMPQVLFPNYSSHRIIVSCSRQFRFTIKHGVSCTLERYDQTFFIIAIPNFQTCTSNLVISRIAYNKEVRHGKKNWHSVQSTSLHSIKIASFSSAFIGIIQIEHNHIGDESPTCMYDMISGWNWSYLLTIKYESFDYMACCNAYICHIDIRGSYHLIHIYIYIYIYIYKAVFQ